MKVKVLFFGATADSLGDRSVEVSLEENLKASDALDAILKALPKLAEKHSRGSLHFSINHEYAKGDEKIQPGDELAVFTAVSGG